MLGVAFYNSLKFFNIYQFNFPSISHTSKQLNYIKFHLNLNIDDVKLLPVYFLLLFINSYKQFEIKGQNYIIQD